jgi:spectrin beta
MTARGQKLLGAGEIHKFNRDVADALARIQEKLNEIPDAVGKDVGASEALLRAHEQFENDLVPLEAQMQVKLSATAVEDLSDFMKRKILFFNSP